MVAKGAMAVAIDIITQGEDGRLAQLEPKKRVSRHSRKMNGKGPKGRSAWNAKERTF